jgi:hypothetical protein
MRLKKMHNDVVLVITDVVTAKHLLVDEGCPLQPDETVVNAGTQANIFPRSAVAGLAHDVGPPRMFNPMLAATQFSAIAIARRQSLHNPVASGYYCVSACSAARCALC